MELKRERVPVQVLRDELDLIVELACSLDEKPGSNWVEDAGGLPDYICRIARAIKRSGKTTSQAIAIAISRVKRWAAGAGGVNADTKAKAAAAVAQWEKLKAKSHARAAKKVAATNTSGPHYGHDHVFLAVSDIEQIAKIRAAFLAYQERTHQEWLQQDPNTREPEQFIREVWPEYIVVSSDTDANLLFKIPYESEGDDVNFGEIKGVTSPLVILDDLSISDAALEAAVSMSYQLRELVDKPRESSVDKLLRLSVLTTEGRNRLKDSDFAIPEKKKYPIHDRAHARNALVRVAQHGTPEEKRRVRAAVKRKYPDMDVSGDD